MLLKVDTCDAAVEIVRKQAAVYRRQVGPGDSDRAKLLNDHVRAAMDTCKRRTEELEAKHGFGPP